MLIPSAYSAGTLEAVGTEDFACDKRWSTRGLTTLLVPIPISLLPPFPAY